MTKMKLFVTFTIAAAFAPSVDTALAQQTTAGAKIKIVVTYDQVRVPVDPNLYVERRYKTREYTLSGSGDLHILATEMSKLGSDVELGKDYDGSNAIGRKFKNTYRILDGTLFIITDYGGYAAVRKIRTDGVRSCTCTEEYQKKKGIQLFEFLDAKGVREYKDIHVENMTCTVKQVDP